MQHRSTGRSTSRHGLLHTLERTLYRVYNITILLKLYWTIYWPIIRYDFSCPPIYLGEYCQHVNPCHSGPGPRCQNGGTCSVKMSVTAGPQFTCSCPIGYSASLCEIAVPNSCDSNPCQNGGTCSLFTLDKFTCTCAAGYRGTYIIISSIEFLRGSTLVYLRLYLYTCLSFRVSGPYCELMDHCASQPCRNGATCTSINNSYKCKCATGFTGPTCTNDTNECKKHPCVHGTCLNTFGSYRWDH